MYPSNKTLWIAPAIGGTVLAAAALAWACSIDLPPSLLEQRETRLTLPVVNSFYYEIRRLTAAPQDSLRSTDNGGTNVEYLRDQAESQDGGGDLAQMRQAATVEQAWDAGAKLPAAIRLYTTGAVAYRLGQRERAADLFQQVLDLPGEDGRPRAVWAAFMLGRMADNADQANSFLARTRDLARQGWPDPLGLATATFGEEARPHFWNAKAALSTPADGGMDRYVAEMTLAQSLYLQQAIRGSEGGAASLRILVKNILEQESRTQAALAQPELRRLIVAYLLTRQVFFVDGNAEATETVALADRVTDPDSNPDAPSPPMLPPLKVLEMLSHTPTAARTDTDRLAHIAYQLGRYDLARVLVAQAEDNSLSWWLRAKLAIQDGQLDQAAQFYAKAVEHVRSGNDTTSLDQDNKDLLLGESGVNAVNRGEWARAAALFLESGKTYWTDLAYVAERVMTTDELKAFVDSTPATRSPPGQTEPTPVGTPDDLGPAPALRDLLARRLMRDGRRTESLPYYLYDRTRADAQAYDAALADGGKAQSWFQAATLARQSGMELMGTEAEPDYAQWGGAYDLRADDDRDAASDVPSDATGERARYAASAPTPYHRFHYRSIAISHALKAADLLPPRSQAFAAVLCHAAQWALSLNDQPQAQTIYRRYVAQGAMVPFATHFGHSCPAPDFAGAPTTMPRYYLRKAMRHGGWLAAGAGVIMGGLAGMWWWRKRRRA